MAKSKGKKSETATFAVPAAGAMEIPLSKILVDEKFNARTQGLDDKSIAEFAETIKREGMLQPVVVEPLEDGTYFLKAGFRRVAAANLLGWKTIKGVIKLAEGEKKEEQEVNRYFTNFVENVARANLTPYDTAMRCKLLKSEYDISGSEIAKRLGKNTGYINNLLAIVGEGEKGDHKGATLAPDIMRQWQTECSWGDEDKRTKVCTTDTLRRWLRFPHEEQMKLFNRAMYHAENPSADMAKYDAQQAAAQPTPTNPNPPGPVEAVRATKSQIEKALDAVKEKLKTSKDGEKVRLNGVKEGLEFALGVKPGLKNQVRGIIAFKDGSMVEGPQAVN